MADRYPYDRERDGRDDSPSPRSYGERGRNDGGYTPRRSHTDAERGPVERGGDDVRSWFGDDDAAWRRRMDERERDRFETDARDRWGTTARWGQDRYYGSERPYGDRGYGWQQDQNRAAGWREMPERDRGWRDQSPAPSSYARMSQGHHLEPDNSGQFEPGSHTLGGSYARERVGAREWSGVEGWRVPGPHAGRGPRGYQRSDERIHDEINERLTAHGLIDASDVECRVTAGEVTLTGFVDSRAAKRAAEDLAEDIYGVREVHNQIRVRSHADAGGGVGRTSVLGLTEAQLQTPHSSAASATETGRPRTRS